MSRPGAWRGWRPAVALLTAVALAAADPVTVVAGPAPSPFLAGLTVSGEQLFAGTCSFMGLPLQELRTVPRIKQGILTLSELSARGFGGKMAGEHRLSLVDGTHDGSLRVEQVDLITLVRHFGGAAENLSGTVGARVSYHIDPSKAERVSARIEVEINDARLIQLPVLVDLLAGDPGGPRGQDKLFARLELHGERIDVVVAELTSPSAELRITGSVTLGGDLDLRVSPRLRFRWAEAFPGIGTTIAKGLGRFSSSAVLVRIRGHISKPVIVTDTFGLDR